MFGSVVPYSPPSWLIQSGGIPLSLLPRERVVLGRFPTPVHRFPLQEVEDKGLELHIKRDDTTSFDLSGNKVRKLEFLLADALQKGCDSVITIGGMQSNHCRATAVATRQLGLQPVLLLRKPDKAYNVPLPLTGNLLLDRMVDAKIYTVPTSVYAQHGEFVLGAELASQLKASGKQPYLIPVGGSNALGSLGYMECVNELIQSGEQYDHIVFACGSGGTAAGLAIGTRLAGLKAQVHAIGVCDDPDYFYSHIEQVAEHYGIDQSVFGSPRSWCHIHMGAGLGYAKSSNDELRYLFTVSQRTGIVLDPVYSGKALYYFVHDVLQRMPELFQRGQRVLFIHTGGTLGLYDKVEQLAPLLPESQEIPMMLAFQ